MDQSAQSVTDKVSFARFEGGLTMAQASAAIPMEMQREYRRLEHWRRTRLGKAPFPERLWTADAQLSRSHGVCRTAQLLHLEYNKLKQLG
jgi:hypothetical protein